MIKQASSDPKWHTKSGGIDIYRTLHPKAIKYTFYLSAHGSFSKIDHTLGHRVSMYTFKAIEIPSILDHIGMKLEINYNKNSKTFKHVEAKQHVIKQWMSYQWDQGRNQKLPGNMKTQNNQKSIDRVKTVLRGIFIALKFYLKKRKISNKL